MANRGRLFKTFLILVGLVGMLGTFYPTATHAETLSQLLARQAELKAQAEQNRKKLEEKKGQVSDLKGVIDDIDGDIGYTESRISNTEDQVNISQRVIDELNSDIQQSQSQLDDLQSRLKNAYVSLYELSQTSAVDSILSSSSLNDIVSQAQYIQTLQSELQSNIAKAQAIKTDLESKKIQSESQKAELLSLKNDLKSSKSSLSNQRSRKSYLLAQTQGEQAQYEAVLKKLESQQESIGQAIYDARAAQSGGEQINGGTGNYPWAGEPNAYAVDPWLYYKRQCTSFAAWKFLSVYGQNFYNTRPGQGSAWNWPNLARDQGYQTSTTPRQGAIVSWPIGQNMPYGHVAWVNRVNNNGTIDVEEYNWTVARGYSQRLNVDPTRYGSATYIFP